MGVSHSMDSGLEKKGIIPPILLLLTDNEEPADPTLPVAEAVANSDVLVSELVQLNGSNSSDPEDRPLTFLWSLNSKPASSLAELDSITSETPEFVLDLPGTYVVQLVVNNGVKDSVPDILNITNLNRVPLADAGLDSIELLNQAVSLDGSNSSDLDTDPLSYAWAEVEKPAGSAALLSDPSLVNPVFTPDVKGNYIFDLVVNDGITDSDPDQIEILAGVELTLDVTDTFIGVGRETTATLTLDFPAPVQGVEITLSVDATIIGLDSTQLLFTAGETEKAFTLAGLTSGITTLSAVGTNIPEVSLEVEVSGALVSVAEIEPMAPSESRSLAISLSEPAPAGGVIVNLESLDTGVATVTPASLVIDAGAITPSTNAQVTGVSLGNTVVRATANDFAPDERDVVVALSAEFDPASLDVPETLDRNIVIQLDGPAPTGGVNFDLSIVGDENFSAPLTANIAEGQTQSQPITLTGITEGVSTLLAEAEGFIDAEAEITVTDAPDAFLTTITAHLSEAEIGVGLQSVYRIRLESAPTTGADIQVSVPIDSGVLLSFDSNAAGSNTLVFEDVTSTTSGFMYIQGTELGDDVPLTIEVFDANTTNLAGYESLASTVDIDPSGVFITTGDYETTTFSTPRLITVSSALLFDDESARDGEFRTPQRVRGGTQLQVPMQVSDSNLLALPGGATDTLTIESTFNSSNIAVTPLANGMAEVSIADQPAGFSLPTDRDDSVAATITAPNAFLRTLNSASQHLQEAIVGVDLQQRYRIGLESAPPSPVDIVVSVPANSGVALSALATMAGTSEVTFENVTSASSSDLYIQGLAIGDDVPIAISVFNADTTTAAGYNVLPSTADIDPSGIRVTTGDYNTTTFSNNTNISVTSHSLFDDETFNRIGEVSQTQSIRGGLDLIVPMQVGNALIASLPAGGTDDLVIQSGTNTGLIALSPESSGTTTVFIQSPPSPFTIPANADDIAEVTVSAADAFLRSTSNNHLAEAVVGIGMQQSFRIGMAVSPPENVDIVVSVDSGNGVLLSDDNNSAGGLSVVYENVSSSISNLFYIQGTALGDDVPINISIFRAGTTDPIGYNILASTIDVDPSGVYVSTSDFSVNNFASDRPIQVTSALLFDGEDTRDGQFRQIQNVRAGTSLDVSMEVDNPSALALPGGNSGILTIVGGSSSGTILADPLTVGDAAISIVEQPDLDFSLPTNRDNVVNVTVVAPDVRINLGTVLVGDELQQPINVTLSETPPNPVDVTIEVSSAVVALVSNDDTMQGSSTVTFPGVTTANVGTVYVQGLTLNGATEITGSAAGYNDDTAAVEVDNSGFSLSGFFSDVNVGATRNLTIRANRLNDNGTFAATQEVRGGVSFDISVSSSLPSVGTVTSPITLSSGVSQTITTFTGVAPGTTTIQITQPAGDFIEPSGSISGDITVN